MFGSVDMRKQTRRGLVPLSYGVIACNGQREERGSVLNIDLRGFNRAEQTSNCRIGNI